MKQLLKVILLMGLVVDCGKKEGQQPEVKPIPQAQAALATQAQKAPTEPKANLDSLSPNDLWAGYKKLREKSQQYEKQGEYQQAVASLIEGAAYALKLDRPDIASWQYNNAGKNTIDDFKAKTKYVERMSNLNTIKAGPQKNKFWEETRGLLKREMPVLEKARGYLNKADVLNQQNPDAKRGKVIVSNLNFIKEIEEFITEKVKK